MDYSLGDTKVISRLWFGYSLKVLLLSVVVLQGTCQMCHLYKSTSDVQVSTHILKSLTMTFSIWETIELVQIDAMVVSSVILCDLFYPKGVFERVCTHTCIWWAKPTPFCPMETGRSWV